VKIRPSRRGWPYFPGVPATLGALVAAGVSLLCVGTVAAQWEPTARLGLSAAPDRHVDQIATPVGEPFTLYVILAGLPDAPLAFGLQSVGWVVHTVCCGDSPVGVVDLVHADGLQVTGDPYEEVVSEATDCLQGETVLLATVTFDWLLEGQEQFLLSAGSLTGALACDGGAHLLQTLVVEVLGADPSATEPMTWSAVRAPFAGPGGGP